MRVGWHIGDAALPEGERGSLHYTLAFALRLRKNHGKTCRGSREVAGRTALGTIRSVDFASVLRAVCTGLLTSVTLKVNSHTYNPVPLPCSDNAASFMKVRA